MGWFDGMSQSVEEDLNIKGRKRGAHSAVMVVCVEISRKCGSVAEMK